MKTYRTLEDTVELAEIINEDFAEDKDGWVCKVHDCNNGLAYLEVHDEEGLLGYL